MKARLIEFGLTAWFGGPLLFGLFMTGACLAYALDIAVWVGGLTFTAFWILTTLVIAVGTAAAGEGSADA